MTRLMTTLSLQLIMELSFEIMVNVLLVLLNAILLLVKYVVQDVTTPSFVLNWVTVDNVQFKTAVENITKILLVSEK